MATRNQIKERSSERVRRERAPIPWRYFLLSITCAVILAAGFFYAAKQHFASVDYSMRNSDMRKSKEKLEAEQRKLKVEREMASSYATIEKAGAKIGLRKLATQDFQYIDPAGPNGNTTVADNFKKSADADKDKDQASTTKNGALKDGKTVAAKTAADKKDQPGGRKDAVAKLMPKDTVRPAIARR